LSSKKEISVIYTPQININHGFYISFILPEPQGIEKNLVFSAAGYNTIHIIVYPYATHIILYI